METRSRRRLRVSPPPPPDGGGSRRLPPSSDRISALSDDMLLLVLSRLGSVHAAARTGLLSRRWLGLWTSLAHPAFCTDASDKIEAALARFSVSPVVSSIHIRFPVTRQPSSLLRAAARLSPAELVFVLKEESWQTYSASVVLPCLCRATTIEIDAGLLGIRPPPAGEFPALEKLFVAGDIIDFGSLLSRCPCLRVLGVTFRDVNPDSLDAALATLEPAATVHSLELPLFSVQIGTRWRNLLTPLDSAAFSAPWRGCHRGGSYSLTTFTGTWKPTYGCSASARHRAAIFPCSRSCPSVATSSTSAPCSAAARAFAFFVSFFVVWSISARSKQLLRH
ncbi:hypothetical protein ACQ4PT_015065 [Festuca glaucescens]